MTGDVADLCTRADVHDLVVAFYREIVFDELLGPVFEDVAEVDWAVHLPKLVDYWCQVLLHEAPYDGALMAAHHEVHRREPFRVEHFDRWFSLWTTSVDSKWHGPIAQHAKLHAARTAGLISRRLCATGWQPAAESSPIETGRSAL